MTLDGARHQPSEPLAGATRLADGYAVAALLRSEAPAAFEFFCRAPLPFQHVAGDVHVSATRPVFTLDRVSGDVVEFCYNETDRAPLDTLSFDDVAAFYEHEGALRRAIGRLERSVRLQPSEAIVVDNRRVMHGRFGFSGKRHLIGCYLTADDWRSRLRVLRRRAAGE
uniref:TauD/TfdA-like domain-containing protein n=2 Tax=Chrysotila carterae TaxID=13221 RepID=A0A7S4B5T1_CHRCT